MKPKVKNKKSKKSKLEIDKEETKQLLIDYKKEANEIFKQYELLIKKEQDKLLMIQKILKHRNDIWSPNKDIQYNNLKINTWFNIKETNNQNVNFNDQNYNIKEKDCIKYKCKKIELELNKKQKHIINSWLKAYSEMYNMALKYIKDNISENKKILNFQYLRNSLKKDKEILVKKSDIKVHDIDYAIKLVCQNYKSALSNYKNGYIKHFRIRYWRKNKNEKFMDLEKQNFKNNTIRGKILGKVKGYYNGKPYNFNNIDSDCRLQNKDGKYYLFVPNLIVNTDSKVENKCITIDPGLRKFGTCISENKAVIIGENISDRIKKYLKREDKILSNDKINKNTKCKARKMIDRKINNLVNELHWKTINYLTANYKTILIGNMSIKSIVNKKGKLNKIYKRVGLRLNFYKFHQRLKYKCDINDRDYGKINEWLTSKTCSMCGNINEKLGSSEVYNCVNCKSIFDRDINGARNIYIRAIQ